MELPKPKAPDEGAAAEMVTRPIAYFLLAAAYNIDLVVIAAGGIGLGVTQGKPFLQGVIEPLEEGVPTFILLLGSLFIAGITTYDIVKSGGKVKRIGFRAVANFLLFTAFLLDLFLLGDGIIHAMMGDSFLQTIIDILEEGVPALIGLFSFALVEGMLTYKFVKNEDDIQ